MARGSRERVPSRRLARAAAWAAFWSGLPPLDGRATVGPTCPYLCADGGLLLAAPAVPPAGCLPNEVVCHDMRKKVISFPPRKAAPSRPVTLQHTRIKVQVGAQRYTLNIPCEAVGLPPEPVPATQGRLEHLQVQTRFLRLCQPAGLGDHIDDWRVCWVGGWDKCHVLFVVMVQRVVRAARP
jgi:hypothetical protein